MSGSGKSYLINQYLARICLRDGEDSIVYFADFKQDDSFSHLRGCPRYYPYDKTIEALDEVYDIMHKRQCGEDTSKYFVTLIWDEYIANILSISGKDKKKAGVVMNKVSEIIMLGRSLFIRLIIATQRPEASGFPSGSRINFGQNPIRLYSLDEITEIFCKLGLRICNSFADFSGKPSSDNDIQLMVYSIRE